jgi:hypothetical protein
MWEESQIRTKLPHLSHKPDNFGFFMPSFPFSLFSYLGMLHRVHLTPPNLLSFPPQSTHTYGLKGCTETSSVIEAAPKKGREKSRG